MTTMGRGVDAVGNRAVRVAAARGHAVTPAPVETAAPVVVVVDRAWQSFEQFAAALGRHGVDVRYVGIGLRGHSAKVRSLVFPGAVFLPDLAGLAGVLAEHRERVVDVVTNELDLADVLDAARRAGLPERVLIQLASRLPFADKVDAAARLAEWGAPIPRSLPGSADLADVGRELGYPVVVKGRRGAGGLAVEVAGTQADAERARVELARRTGDDVYFEQFATGRNINYAAVHANGRVVVECCFDSVRSHDDATRPGTDLQVVDEPRVLAVGRLVAERLSGVGIVDLEVMTGGDHLAVIDTNLRPFGSMMALRGGGADLVGAYAAAVLGRVVPPSAVHEGATFSVFPTSSEMALDVGIGAGAVDYVRALPRAVRDLGPRYGAMASLAFATRLARTASAALRARG